MRCLESPATALIVVMTVGKQTGAECQPRLRCQSGGGASLSATKHLTPTPNQWSPAPEQGISPSCGEIGASILTWHCVYTKPSKERQVNQSLILAGYETLFLRYVITRRCRHKELRPLFLRYVPVRFDADAPWRLVIRDMVGQEVGKVMCDPTSNAPLVIPDAAIARLREQAAGDIITPKEPREMVTGDTGRPLDGDWSRLSGICQMTSRDRVWLLLSLMGGPRLVSFDRDKVEIVE